MSTTSLLKLFIQLIILWSHMGVRYHDFQRIISCNCENCEIEESIMNQRSCISRCKVKDWLRLSSVHILPPYLCLFGYVFMQKMVWHVIRALLKNIASFCLSVSLYKYLLYVFIGICCILNYSVTSEVRHRLATVSTLIHRKHPIIYFISTYCILIMLASGKKNKKTQNRLLNIYIFKLARNVCLYMPHRLIVLLPTHSSSSVLTTSKII